MSTAYLIEFDILDGHHPGTGATLDSSVLASTGWRSIGNASGGRFSNQTGGPLRAIYLKTNNPGDTFTVTAASAGRLFDTVWLKNDNTEVYFMDGHVPNNSTIPNLATFWMRVPRNPQSEIDQCDGGGSCPFTGQAFSANPPDPTGPAWTKLRSAQRATSPKWARLYSACPSQFRDIKAYGESQDGQYVAFIAAGELLLYDDKAAAVSSPVVQETAHSTVNRITFEHDAIHLWRNGQVLRKLRIADLRPTLLGKSSA